jgi:hypothetical protein
MAECHRCASPISAGSRSGLCKRCANTDPDINAKRAEARRRAFELHPEYRQRQREAVTAANRQEYRRKQSGEQAKALRLWELSAAKMTPEVRAQQGRTMTERRLAHIPLAYRDDYRILVRKVGAKEARKAILELAAKVIARAHKL